MIVTARGGKKLDNAKTKLAEFDDVHVITMDATSEESINLAEEWVEKIF